MPTNRPRIHLEPNVKAILFTGLALMATAIGLYLLGLINQHMHGEAFYDFAYADRYPWQESWKEFFFTRHRSRLMHGVFVTILYKLLGYNPPALFLSVYILKIMTSVVIVLILRDHITQNWLAALLTVTITLLPVNIPEFFLLRKVHHALAWFSFWSAIFFVQFWIRQHQSDWLVPATIAFTVSLLAYEAAVGLLLVALFLGLKHIVDLKDFWQKFRVILLITYISSAIFVILEALKPAASVDQYYFKGQFNIFSSLTDLLAETPALFKSIWTTGLFGLYYSPTPIDQWLARALILISTALILAGILSHFQQGRRIQSTLRAITGDKVFALAASGAWLSIVTYFPFILAGQKPDSDSLLGAAIGLIFFALAAYIWLKRVGKPRLAHLLIIATCFYWIFVGVASYPNALTDSARLDERNNNLLLALKERVPNVKENTTFVFVNVGFHQGSICQSMLRMLYGRNNLACIHLLDDRPEVESYIRETEFFIEDTGRLFQYDFVILDVDHDGHVTLVEELSYEEYPRLPIEWADSQPIRTNKQRIITGLGPVTHYYQYLLEHQ